MRAGELVENCPRHGMHLGQHLAVRESDHPDPSLLQVARSLKIMQPFPLLAMLAAVDLDREAFLWTEEIQGVWTDGVLASELGACQLPSSDSSP